MKQKLHTPVMLTEVLGYLNLRPGQTIVDATIGTGGHSRNILERIMPGGRLIGIDRDQDSLAVAREELKRYGDSCDFVYGNFMEIDNILKSLNIKYVDGIVFDLGVSSFQLEDRSRGFSFQYEGPLDMRLDKNSHISAYDLINNLNEEEISDMLWSFGQERWHNRIAHLLVKERQRCPIATTLQLSKIVTMAIPQRYRYYRIHPATRTFQAVRIAVNRDLENLKVALVKALESLVKSGRLCVISFHSLEDRLVKWGLRELASMGKAEIITAKPLVPGEDEARNNPSSRSAKLRVAERIAE
ncbi:MAG: 16S rRNA (cytosine(1402)-N(4))-methyltransferase RsmH [Candidatus Omnitrophota bacterium]